MTTMLIGTIALFILIAVEALYLQTVRKTVIPWKEIIVNINSGGILIWLTRAFTMLVYVWIYRHSPMPFASRWSHSQQFIFTFFAWDFCYYWFHRVHHQIPFLWKIHSTHHQGEHFSLSLSVRNHWFQPLTSFPFFAILAVLGVPVTILAGVASIHLLVQFHNHNGIVKKQGIMEHFMVTPSAHRVHHAINEEYMNKNFSGTFSWDRVFGTFQHERDDLVIRYGTTDGNNSDNTFLANVLPLADYFGVSLNKENKNQFKVSNTFLILGAILLYGLFLIYVSSEHSWSFKHLAFLAAFIFSGTAFLGSVAQGSFRGLLGYAATASCGLASVFTLQLHTHPLTLSIATLLMIHAWSGLVLFSRKQLHIQVN